MKEVKSILEFENGAIMEKVQYALNTIMENIRDVNTDEKTRTLTVKISLTPDEKRKFVSMKSEVATKLRPVKPNNTIVQLSMADGVLTATEVTDEVDGQLAIDGTITETKILKMPVRA
jgi:hypothetical protein